MKTQSNIKPNHLAINVLGNKQEIKLCENITEKKNEENE